MTETPQAQREDLKNFINEILAFEHWKATNEDHSTIDDDIREHCREITAPAAAAMADIIDAALLKVYADMGPVVKEGWKAGIDYAITMTGECVDRAGRIDKNELIGLLRAGIDTEITPQP